MNVNIYLEDALAEQLKQASKETGQPRNAIVREAIRAWILGHQVKAWPPSILKFQGCSDWPAFEKTRDELLNPPEDPFA